MPESKKEENISNMPATQIYLHTKPRSHTTDAQIVLEILNKSVKMIGKSLKLSSFCEHNMDED